MRWKELGEVDCSLARAVSVVGDRWTLLVLRNCFLGVRRFEHFQDQLGISRHLLADRLASLVEHGVLERRRYSERPPRDEYRLTAKGIDLYPVVVSLVGWGDRWMSGPEGPPLKLRHEPCGRGISPVMTCPCCSEPIDPREMRAVAADRPHEAEKPGP